MKTNSRVNACQRCCESDPAASRAAGGTSGFKHIMVAVDESEQALRAADVAFRLAKDLHAQVTLIHVAHLPPVTNPDLAYEDIALRPVYFEAGQTLLDRLARRGGLGTEKVLREGDPATQIIDVATRLGADLLVMGTHGRGRVAAAVVGSVAHKVMSHVTWPVLCVAHPAAMADDREEQTAESIGTSGPPVGVL